MTRNRQLTIAAIGVAVVAVIALIVMRRGAGGAADAAPEPTALVTVATVRSQTVQDVVSLYGTVQSDPAGAVTVAAPRALIVTRVLVRAGQAVAAGQPLIAVANAPATELAYRQAAQALASANAELARVQRLYDARLAASDQLLVAKKAAADAGTAVAAQQMQGAGQASQVISAPRAAVVTTLSVAAGDRLAQDAPILVLAGAGATTVKLGVAPGGAGRVAAGQAVTLYPASGGASVSSRITLVGHTADPATRTLDAIAPMNGAAAPIGAAVRGEVVVGSHQATTAPRAAVVFDETGPHLFTVSGGKARRVFVKVGLDHGDDIEVSGPIVAGAAVAVEGAYELQDGMAVKVRGR